MEDIFVNGVKALANGGPEAIVFGLVLFIVLMIADRQRLIKSLSKKDEVISKKDDRIDEIVQDYYRGNMTLADALNQLRSVLADLKSRIL